MNKQRIHEQMTERYAQCFTANVAEKSGVAAAADVAIAACRDLTVKPGLEIKGDEEQVNGLQVERVPVTFGELKVAVRWPDDPQRKLMTLRGTVNLGLAFEAIKYCGSYTGLGADQAGLLCVSHFGPMQFLHAMASRADETALDTQTKVLEWVHFAYEHVAGRLGDANPLCSALHGFPPIRSALIGSDDSDPARVDRHPRTAP